MLHSIDIISVKHNSSRRKPLSNATGDGPEPVDMHGVARRLMEALGS